MVALNSELDIIEIMARQGMTEREWEQQTFAYIKIQRETATLMHRALLLAGKLVVDQDEWLALREGSGAPEARSEPSEETRDEAARRDPFRDVPPTEAF